MKRRDENDDNRGIRCPQCGCRHFYTTNTEPLRDGRVRRRKVCRYCGRKIVTFEGTITTFKKADCYI
jgi:transcriptional regulator NrdR family protein